MRLINELRKGLITTLALNAALFTVHAQADDQAAGNASLLGERTDVTLGVGARYAPRYLGSKNYTSNILPMLHIERGIFFLDAENGLGVQWQSTSGFSAAASIGHDAGRADGNSKYRYGSDQLKGMGEVSGATVLNLRAAQQLTSWLALNAQAGLRTGGAKRGDQYALGLETTLLNREQDHVTLSFDAHAGDGQFNRTFFGVTPEQNSTSRFARFQADAGLYAYSSELSWLHTFDQHWSSVAGVELTHYTGQVRNSPIVTQDTTAISYLAVNYTF